MLDGIGATELAPGLWRWTAYHPEWKEDVGCVAWATAEDLVLIDPLAPPEPGAGERFLDELERARGGRSLHVLLTVHWHARSAAAIAARLPGARTWASSETAERLELPIGDLLAPGEHLPGGVEAFASARGGELVAWIAEAAALVPGDVLLGGRRRPLRLCPAGWLPDGVGRSELAASLAPLRELPVERVLVSHGEPVLDGARKALLAALDAA